MLQKCIFFILNLYVASIEAKFKQIYTNELHKPNYLYRYNYICMPYIADQKDVCAARQHWWDTRDASTALKHLGKRPCIERHLLVGLEKCAKNDFVGALSSVRFSKFSSACFCTIFVSNNHHCYFKH